MIYNNFIDKEKEQQEEPKMKMEEENKKENIIVDILSSSSTESEEEIEKPLTGKMIPIKVKKEITSPLRTNNVVNSDNMDKLEKSVKMDRMQNGTEFSKLSQPSNTQQVYKGEKEKFNQVKTIISPEKSKSTRLSLSQSSESSLSKPNRLSLGESNKLSSIQSNKSAKSIQSVSPTISTLTQSVKPTKSIQPTQSIKPTKSIQPTQSITPTKSIQPTQSITPTKSTPTNSLSSLNEESMYLARLFEQLNDSDIDNISPTTQVNREFLNLINFIHYLLTRPHFEESFYSSFMQFSKSSLYYPSLSNSSSSPLSDFINSITEEPPSKRQELIRSEESVDSVKDNQSRIVLSCSSYFLSCFYPIQITPSIQLSLEKQQQLRVDIDTIHMEFHHSSLLRAITSSYHFDMYEIKK